MSRKPKIKPGYANAKPRNYDSGTYVDFMCYETGCNLRYYTSWDDFYAIRKWICPKCAQKNSPLAKLNMEHEIIDY